jgi:DNA-binding HxlR family transcriptional regulator
MRSPRARAPTRAQLSLDELAYLIGGLSEKMLSQTLRRLEMDGFVRREMHATKPARVAYSLTPLGCEPGMQSLLTFVHKNANRVIKNRENARQHEAKFTHRVTHGGVSGADLHGHYFLQMRLVLINLPALPFLFILRISHPVSLPGLLLLEERLGLSESSRCLR